MLALLFWACGSNLEKQPVPDELKETWVNMGTRTIKLDIEDDVLVVDDEKLSLVGFEAKEEGMWHAQIQYERYGKENTEIAKIKLYGSDKKVIGFDLIEGEENYGPSSKLYKGEFVQRSSVLIPEKFHGTWTSCEPLNCTEAKLVLSADKIGISGTGKDCVTDEADLEYSKMKVDKLEVKHSGLNSSGWSFFLAEDGDNIVVSDAGEDYMGGTYVKGDQKCGAKAKQAKAKRIGQKQCQEYVDCVCDLGEELASSSSYGTNVYSGQCKQANRYLSAANGKACGQALDSFKKALEQVEDMYEMVGIDIPYSCK